MKRKAFHEVCEKMNSKGTVAVIDDDEAARVSIGQMLRLRRYRVEEFASAEAALAWTSLLEADALVTDIKMPGMDGEQFLRELVEGPAIPPVIMITGHGDVATAVRCLKAGAYDFIEKPFDDEVLLAAVARAVEKSALRRERESLRRQVDLWKPEEIGKFGMVGTSRASRIVYEQIEVFAESDAPVLIFGETGTGKELVARSLHARSRRSGGPFVPVNAGALPESTLESELFGHVRGAFTGADREREGKLVAASGGTMLLDEIESIAERAQIQLLRVLEDGLVQPLGSDKPRPVDIRLVATTKLNLKQLVAEGKMRADFYHRVVVLEITVPPLRERAEDIPLLVSHFVKLHCSRTGAEPPEIPKEALGRMTKYRWPGNVRELKNAVERMLVTARQGVAGVFDFEEGDGGDGGNGDSRRLLSLPNSAGLLREELERTERERIESALREYSGEINSTSRALGISRRGLYERMKKYGMNKEDFR